MTLSFHKVNFSAQEVFDLLAEFMPEHIHDDDGTVEGCPGCFPPVELEQFACTFWEQAEERSRASTIQQPLVTRLDPVS